MSVPKNFRNAIFITVTDCNVEYIPYLQTEAKQPSIRNDKEYSIGLSVVYILPSGTVVTWQGGSAPLLNFELSENFVLVGKLSSKLAKFGAETLNFGVKL